MTLWQDIRYAVRAQRRTPGVTAVIVLTLALGIGAATSIFTVIDAVLLRPLNFARPEQMVMIRPTTGARLSPAYFDEWRKQNATLQDMAAWYDVRPVLTGRGEPTEVLVDRVTPNFFTLLGTPPTLGRMLTSDGSLSAVAPEALVSQGFWERRLGRDPRVLGQTLTLDGESFTIVGVMPANFKIRTNELAESRAEVWVPFLLTPGAKEGMGGTLNVVGRLREATTPAQAQTDLARIASQIEAAYPSYSRDWRVRVQALQDATVERVRQTLVLLLAAVAILLIIACANVANLMLMRATARQSEVAVRTSLGAARTRLASQFLTESLVLACLAGVLGVVLARWGTDLLVSSVPAGFDLPRRAQVSLDARAIAAAMVMVIGTALMFGVLPALRWARLGHIGALAAARGSTAPPSRARLGGMLVVAEIALALVLLVAAGLLTRSVQALTRVNPGFQPQGTISMRTTLPAPKYDTDDRVRTFGRELLERTAAVPGVAAVGFADYLPMSRGGSAGLFEIEGRPTAATEPRSSWISVAGGAYFEAMGIPLLRGRVPGRQDTERTTPVFVIDEALARKYWPDSDPLGARLIWTFAGETLAGDVIGIVGDVRWTGMARDPQPTTYFWFPQLPKRQFAIVARFAGDPRDVSSQLSASVQAIDPSQPVADVRTLQDFVDDDLAQPRFTMTLVGMFAAVALLLAGIGIYAVMAFDVAQRAREIGLRMALGAQRRDVLRMVMTRGACLVAVGLAVGGVGAVAIGRLFSGLLFGTSSTDPATLSVVAIFLAAIAMIAAYIPARRAARVDPMATLGAEN